jgi:hypothetical protein
MEKYVFFFNYAIKRRASKHTVKLLLQVFPTSCLAQDHKGRVPLNYACSSFMLEYLGDLLLLLDFDPDSLSIEDDQGKTLLQYLSADAFVRLENDYFPYTSFSIHSLILSGGEKYVSCSITSPKSI